MRDGGGLRREWSYSALGREPARTSPRHEATRGPLFSSRSDLESGRPCLLTSGSVRACPRGRATGRCAVHRRRRARRAERSGRRQPRLRSASLAGVVRPAARMGALPIGIDTPGLRRPRPEYGDPRGASARQSRASGHPFQAVLSGFERTNVRATRFPHQRLNQALFRIDKRMPPTGIEPVHAV